MPNKYNVSLVQTSDKIGPNVMLPLAIGILWQYVAQDTNIQEKFCLDQVIYRKDNINEQAKLLSRSDIVCFSNYIWNFQYHIALAKEIKNINPNTFILFGGPSVGYSAGDFWLFNRRWVDLLILGEGEESLLVFLQNFPNMDVKSIPGASTSTYSNPLPERQKIFKTDISPYLNGFYDRMLCEIKNNNEVAQAVIQTNRGCPYHCNFCEEGDDYKNKIFEYEYDRVCKEFLWCATNEIEYINLADDNFGMLSRDLDLLQYVIDLKLKHGYPKVLDATFAKNSPDRILAMAGIDVSRGANLLKSITIALQSFHQPTLDAIERFNLKEDKIKTLVDGINKIGMSNYVELIWPLPYETYETFCQGIDKSSELNLTNWVSVYPLTITPGTSIDKDFANDFKYSAALLPSTTSFDDRIKEKMFQVYETTWVNHQDVVKGQVFYAWVAVLYYFGFARYMIDNHARSSNTTVSSIVNAFINYANQHKDSLFGKWTSKLMELWSARLSGKSVHDVSIFPKYDTMHWFYFTHLASWINEDRPRFYSELKNFASLINLQNQDLIFELQPDYVISNNKQYPYMKQVNGINFEVISNVPEKINFNNNFEFSQYFYFWKRKNGWHRTTINLK